MNAAALLGFTATGIELEPGRHQRACAAARALLRQVGESCGGLPPRFLHTSFVGYDFTDADFVWANSIVYGPEMMEVAFRGRFESWFRKAVADVARKMRPGSLIATHKSLGGIAKLVCCEATAWPWLRLPPCLELPSCLS